MPEHVTARKKRLGRAAERNCPELQPQDKFLKHLHLEQRRTERSRRRFVLLLLESEKLFNRSVGQTVLADIIESLLDSTRETDTTGWYREGAVIGTIFTEIESMDGHSVAQALLMRCTNALSSVLSVEQINQIHISLHVFPDDWDAAESGSSKLAVLCPEADEDKRAHWVKRSLDIAGSLAALALAAPVLLGVAAVVKLTSKGPILFRQQRVGRYGKPFTFLKFRSMYVKNDHQDHEAFVKRMIQAPGTSPGETAAAGGVYKMTNDPRVTPIGKFLRRTSLDEMPQFVNVLLGDMSLVGPRPPIQYEVKYYDIWHRRRLLGVKPGITGIWQVAGRSRVGFDEMVRMDLQYANSWSVLLDLKLLLQTPRAVIGGDGAY